MLMSCETQRVYSMGDAAGHRPMNRRHSAGSDAQVTPVFGKYGGLFPEFPQILCKDRGGANYLISPCWRVSALKSGEEGA